ncbi:phosphate ABC transporter permease PstA [Malonomonas rubra]|uniref:phosphate ABC transporter permease PstA n=1 Tax=Malonomonas rubra TaxID=57040 RepID=UPI0026EF8907|nr:phosphate ABC transporter permease PstA [Malonomonas rubra]
MFNRTPKEMNKYWRVGEPMVWLSGAALSLTLLSAAILLLVIMVSGLGVFWPSPLQQLELKDGSLLVGMQTQVEETADHSGMRRQYKIANRDLNGLDFRWIDEAQIVSSSTPADLLVLERAEYGDFFGRLQTLEGKPASLDQLRQALHQVETARAGLSELDQRLIEISYRGEQLRLKLLKIDYHQVAANEPQRIELSAEKQAEADEFERLVKVQSERLNRIHARTAVFSDANGQQKEIVLADILKVYTPNTMSSADKARFYVAKLWELVSGEPRESNTEGGLFPAIFGTVMLIFVMSLFSFPLGVIAAVYLREYAKEGLLVRIVRIAVNNLAGIPSIVYGIFGLGFFVYGIGHSIDVVFFPERLPTPTFGTGGLLWASLTLALLTVPVVIVSTEEALGAIPREMREGSYALGATKFQTLLRVLLPMASPGIMTGLILAMARAAGEVAPLMITGVVKLAPTLPIDGNFPFLHLDRKFMHLGFHIYDIGFQSPNVEAAKPMVFVTALLLVLIVLLMSSVAIRLRNKMKKRYTFGTF